MARPSLFTPERQAAILESLREFGHQDAAAEATGINRETLRLWLERGREARAKADDPEWEEEIPEEELGYLAFLGAVEQARAEAEMAVVGVVKRGIMAETVQETVEEVEADGGRTLLVTRYRPPDLRTARWYLEHAHPTRWGGRVEVSGPDGGPIPVAVEVSARETLLDHLGLVAERLGVVESTPVEEPSPQGEPE